MTPIQQMQAKIQDVIEKAKQLYGMDLSKVQVTFDLRGRAAGMACARGSKTLGWVSFKVRFNRDMLTREAFDHMLNDTVPHEFAHILCFMNPALGNNHDYGWARVCRALGGSGATRHQEEVVYGKGATYEYTTDRGHKVRLSDKRHSYIQAGGSLRYKHGKGSVTKMCAYSIVGVRGQTLANPVVRQAPNHPAEIEANVRAAALPPTTRVQPLQRTMPTGVSKVDVARAIMLSGYQRKMSREEMIQAIMHANGHTRALATVYYKGNTARVGIPADY